MNTEYSDKIEQIQNNNPHDIVEINSPDGVMGIKWDEILSVYAVKVATDPNSAMEVVTIDDSKIGILRSVMWDMNNITHSTSTRETERTVVSVDENGNEVTTTEIVTETVLTITVTHKAPSVMVTQYAFTSDQRRQLDELLSNDYRDLWAQLLGGYTTGNGEIIISGADWIGTDIFSWPLPESFRISSQFGYRSDPITGETKYHSGIDIAAPAGTPIIAPADGIVTAANATDSWGQGYGYNVKLNHNDTFDTFYAHCSSIAVRSGQEVKKGEIIGYVGTTGKSTGNHLHFEVWQNGTRVNPLSYFN